MSTLDKRPFHEEFKRDLTVAEWTYVEGNAMCYLGSAAAFNDPTSGEPVVVVARNHESLARFLWRRGEEVKHLYPVAVLQQKHVRVVDDL